MCTGHSQPVECLAHILAWHAWEVYCGTLGVNLVLMHSLHVVPPCATRAWQRERANTKTRMFHAHKLPVCLAGCLLRASARGYARTHTHNCALDLFAESMVQNFHAFILAHGAATILITNHKLYKVEQPCWFAALLPVSTRTLVSA
jgi:hypothetical protein